MNKNLIKIFAICGICLTTISITAAIIFIPIINNNRIEKAREYAKWIEVNDENTFFSIKKGGEIYEYNGFVPNSRYSTVTTVLLQKVNNEVRCYEYASGLSNELLYNYLGVSSDKIKKGKPPASFLINGYLTMAFVIPISFGVITIGLWIWFGFARKRGQGNK
jgi:hypothetical protein